MDSNSLPSTDVFNGDPKYIGPGVWFALHTMAKNATTPTLKISFKQFLYSLSEEFTCPVCRNHISEFLGKHPLDSYWYLKDSLGRDIGLFKYTWIFHNAVNKRLHKPLMDFDTALSIYYSNLIVPCTVGCGDPHP